jgi:hypothetical protein
MGLAAFAVFVLPWALLAVFLTRSPTALRLGTAPAPWRALPTHRDLARADRRETHPHDTRAPRNGSATAQGRQRPTDASPQSGALGQSVEPTEPDDKV